MASRSIYKATQRIQLLPLEAGTARAPDMSGALPMLAPTTFSTNSVTLFQWLKTSHCCVSDGSMLTLNMFGAC